MYGRVPFGAVMVISAAVATTFAAVSDSLIVSWALGLARRAERSSCCFAVSKLARQGERGVAALVSLASDETSIAVRSSHRHAGLVPPDGVCDIALDALRRIRLGPNAPRTFEWNASAELPTYEAALAAWRREELDQFFEWRRRGGPR